VLSLLGRYFYNLYIVNMLEIVFPLMLRKIIYFHVDIVLNMVVFFANTNEYTYPNGRVLLQMYIDRVVVITKRRNCHC